MGQARQRGTFEERQAEALFYASEKARYQKWLKDHRPRVTWINSHGGKSSYQSCNRLHELLAMAEVWGQRYGRGIHISAI